MFPSIPRQQIDELLYRFLRTIYHAERDIFSDTGLNYQEIYLLQYLRRREAARVSAVAAALDLPLFAASRLVSRLVQRRYLRKERAADDRREVLVRLSPEGEEAVRAVEDRNYRILAQNTGAFTDLEILHFIEVSENLHRLLGLSERVIVEEAGIGELAA